MKKLPKRECLMPITRYRTSAGHPRDAEKLGGDKSVEETLAYWLKRGHDTDENVNSAYGVYDVLLSSEEIQNARVIKMPETNQNKDKPLIT
jgi:hypothetical protein